MRMFAQFIVLGMSNVGTQALVAGSKDFFFLGLIAVQQVIEEAWNQQLVPFLFRFNNFAIGDNGLPKIHWMDPGNVDVQAIMNAYSTATSIGALTPTPEDEEHFRNVLDLPEMPDEDEFDDLIQSEEAPETPLDPEEEVGETEAILPEVAINGL